LKINFKLESIVKTDQNEFCDEILFEKSLPLQIAENCAFRTKFNSICLRYIIENELYNDFLTTLKLDKNTTPSSFIKKTKPQIVTDLIIKSLKELIKEDFSFGETIAEHHSFNKSGQFQKLALKRNFTLMDFIRTQRFELIEPLNRILEMSQDKSLRN